MSRLILSIIASATLLISGCSGQFAPVSGIVVFADGTPIKELAGSRVLFEAVGSDGKNYSSEGEITGDGTFQLTTVKPGDGAVVGKNRVLIERKMLDPERAAPRVVHEKYERFETSGIELDVQPGNNKFTITLDPVAGKKR